MGYRELIELYKKNELSGNELKKIEEDIERQEAISEFLFEKAEDDDFLYTSFEKEDSTDTREFTKEINRRIRRAFLKFGFIISGCTVAVLLFIILALPEIVDSFYYDPEKNGNQMSLDLAVYTEATMPGYNRENVNVESNGYGDYDILIYQNVSYTGTFTHVAGEIEKGELTLYNPNVLRRPTGNAFAWFQMEGDSNDSLTELIESENKTNYCAAGERDYAMETLENLDENKKYMAYVSLNRMMRYEEFMQYLQQSSAYDEMADLWCAVCTMNGIEDVDTSENGIVNEDGTVRMSMFHAENLGFNCTLTSSTALEWNREEYPSLLLWDEQVIENNLYDELKKNILDEEYMQTHFVSMMRYLADQEEFLEMMNERKEEFETAADYVEKNGLMVYGYAGIADKEALLELVEEEEVFEIYTQEM